MKYLYNYKYLFILVLRLLISLILWHYLSPVNESDFIWNSLTKVEAEEIIKSVPQNFVQEWDWDSEYETDDDDDDDVESDGTVPAHPKAVDTGEDSEVEKEPRDT